MAPSNLNSTSASSDSDLCLYRTKSDNELLLVQTADDGGEMILILKDPKTGVRSLRNANSVVLQEVGGTETPETPRGKPEFQFGTEAIAEVEFEEEFDELFRGARALSNDEWDRQGHSPCKENRPPYPQAFIRWRERQAAGACNVSALPPTPSKKRRAPEKRALAISDSMSVLKASGCVKNNNFVQGKADFPIPSPMVKNSSLAELEKANRLAKNPFLQNDPQKKRRRRRKVKKTQA